MNEFSIYLLKVSASMSLFYIVYWLFMRKETFFRMNRIYLLTALIISLILPILTVKYTVITSEQLPDANLLAGLTTDTEENINILPILLLRIYYIGVILFFIRIFWQFAVLLSIMLKSGIKKAEGTRIVYNTKFQMPFSFMNMIFINPENIRDNEVDDIIAHEKVHIRENHWFDLLIVELMSIILWFNPFIWFFERSVKQNHEYLADKGVIAQGYNVNRYHSVLINQLLGMEVIGITNNLNYSLNTNRLKMMKKQKTPKLKALHLIWVLPVLIGLLAAFAQPVYEDVVKNNVTIIGKTVSLKVAVYNKKGSPLKGAIAFVKGSDKKVKTNAEGIFELKVSKSDIVIIKYEGYDKGVIYMKKLVAKNGDAEKYKLKMILSKQGENVPDKLSKSDEIKKLESMLKELTMKKEDLTKMKKKLAQAEKEGTIEKDVLEKKKANLKESYIAVSNKMKKVEYKLQELKK